MKTHSLRPLIKNDLDPQKHSLSALETESWKLAISHINDQLLQEMNFLYHCPFSHSVFKNAVCGIQSECISLLNAAEKLRGLEPESKHLLEGAKTALEELLNIIAVQYSDYAAEDIFMANCSFLKSIAEIKQSYKVLANALWERKVEVELQQVILNPILDMSNRKRCTYGKMNYVRVLQEEMILVLEKTPGDPSGPLLALLLSMNFNTDEFVQYYSKKIGQELEAVTDQTKKPGLLKKYERQFKNPPYRKKKLHFDVTRRCASALLHQFVVDELCAAIPVQPLVVPVTAKGLNEAVQANGPRQIKIHSLLGIDPLSFLFRLLVDAEALKPDGKKEFCDFLAAVFTTSRTGKRPISGNSLYTKFRSPTKASKRAIRNLLSRMIKLIDQGELI